MQKISTPKYTVSIARSYSQSNDKTLPNYLGVVWTVTPLLKDELAKYNPTAFSILCKASQPIVLSKSQVQFSKDYNSASCPKGMQELK